jgi:hypothetical protein
VKEIAGCAVSFRAVGVDVEISSYGFSHRKAKGRHEPGHTRSFAVGVPKRHSFQVAGELRLSEESAGQREGLLGSAELLDLTLFNFHGYTFMAGLPRQLTGLDLRPFEPHTHTHTGLKGCNQV